MAEYKNYITPEGYARLKDEFDQLYKVERPKVVADVAWAASNGDRSENGDYIYGKKRLRQIDSRLRFLLKRMDAAEVVEVQARTGSVLARQRRAAPLGPRPTIRRRQVHFPPANDACGRLTPRAELQSTPHIAPRTLASRG